MSSHWAISSIRVVFILVLTEKSLCLRSTFWPALNGLSTKEYNATNVSLKALGRSLGTFKIGSKQVITEKVRLCNLLNVRSRDDTFQNILVLDLHKNYLVRAVTMYKCSMACLYYLFFTYRRQNCVGIITGDWNCVLVKKSFSKYFLPSTSTLAEVITVDRIMTDTNTFRRRISYKIFELETDSISTKSINILDI